MGPGEIINMGEGAGGENEICSPLTFILSRKGRGDISGFVRESPSCPG